MFKRKIYQKLSEWKQESDGKTALLIEGARRRGKSTVVEEFLWAVGNTNTIPLLKKVFEQNKPIGEQMNRKMHLAIRYPAYWKVKGQTAFWN